MKRQAAKFVSRLRFSHVLSFGLTLGLLAFLAAAASAADHALFVN